MTGGLDRAGAQKMPSVELSKLNKKTGQQQPVNPSDEYFTSQKSTSSVEGKVAWDGVYNVPLNSSDQYIVAKKSTTSQNTGKTLEEYTKSAPSLEEQIAWDGVYGLPFMFRLNQNAGIKTGTAEKLVTLSDNTKKAIDNIKSDLITYDGKKLTIKSSAKILVDKLLNSKDVPESDKKVIRDVFQQAQVNQKEHPDSYGDAFMA